MSDNNNETVRSVADYITSKYANVNEGGEGAAVEMDADGKSSFDASGRGPMLPDPINADVARNRASIEPKGAVGPDGAVSGDEETEESSDEEVRNEHLEVLFGDENLSEEFKNKAGTIFETVVMERVTAIENTIKEQYEQRLLENTETILNDLSEKLDDYLNYVVEEWLKDNELVVENGIRSDVTENFILGLRNLFEDSYIDVPAEKYELLDGLFEQNEQLENILNESMMKNKELINEMNNLQKMEVFSEVADGLVSTDVERLATLTESISEDSDIEDFKNKLITIRESYFNEPAPIASAVQELTEESTNSRITNEGSNPSAMDGYVDTLSRISKANKVS